MRIAFLTGNRGKWEEAREALAPLGHEVEQVKLDLPEPQADSLDVVARAKVAAARPLLPGPFFVDDAGLFVEDLNGFPGVYSAYALKTLGTAGILKLLEERPDRRARFEAVVGFHHPTRGDQYFKGICYGRLAEAPRDTGHGFGFDPIFIPDGYGETFAELPTAEKNRVSHRGRAMAMFCEWLSENPLA